MFVDVYLNFAASAFGLSRPIGFPQSPKPINANCCLTMETETSKRFSGFASKKPYSYPFLFNPINPTYNIMAAETRDDSPQPQPLPRTTQADKTHERFSSPAAAPGNVTAVPGRTLKLPGAGLGILQSSTLSKGLSSKTSRNCTRNPRTRFAAGRHQRQFLHWGIGCHYGRSIFPLQESSFLLYLTDFHSGDLESLQLGRRHLLLWFVCYARILPEEKAARNAGPEEGGKRQKGMTFPTKYL